MNTTSRPATPDQIRLLIGLSSLMVLPMVAVVGVFDGSPNGAGPRARLAGLCVRTGSRRRRGSGFGPLRSPLRRDAAHARTRPSCFAVYAHHSLVPARRGWTAGAAGGPRNDRIYRGWRGRPGDGLAHPVAPGHARIHNAPPLAPSPARGEGDWGSGLEEAGVDRRTLDDLVTRALIDRGVFGRQRIRSGDLALRYGSGMIGVQAGHG